MAEPVKDIVIINERTPQTGVWGVPLILLAN